MPELERPSPQDFNLQEPASDPDRTACCLCDGRDSFSYLPVGRIDRPTDRSAAGLDRPNRRCHLGESWSADLVWAMGVVVSGGPMIPFLPRLAIALGLLVAAAYFWRIV